jgi:hypothetical protein
MGMVAEWASIHQSELKQVWEIGEVDLSDLVGKGVFRVWKDPDEFAKVYLDEESGTLAWPGGLDLAPDALYQEIAGVEAAR